MLRIQNWHTFLRNHTVWACDFLREYDVWFRPIFAFFTADINAKQVVHVGVTRHPTAQWTAQQMREATPFGIGPELIIRDNDGKFGADFDRAAKGAGIRVIRTAVQAPLMNSVCERFLGSVRRDCLDHTVILGERHLEHLLKEYCFNYFNIARPHQGIEQRVPTRGALKGRTDPAAVIAIPVLGGLHHAHPRGCVTRGWMWVAVGTALCSRARAAPRTDPSERHYRTVCGEPHTVRNVACVVMW